MKARYLFGAGIMAAIIAIVGLRINATQTVKLRDQILQKDQTAGDVSADITRLRQFVFSHMNSSVRFELTASYNRAVAAAQRQAQSAVSGEVYDKAQAACGPEVGTNSVAQVACVQKYLDTHLSGRSRTPAAGPNRAEFSYAFAAPTWSPDLAGLGLLVAIIFTTAALIVYIINLFKSRQTA